MAPRSEFRSRRRWTGVAALVLIAAAFGLGGVSTPVSAQDAADAFGGFNLTGRANGIQVSYNVENVFPLPPPLFQLSVPEALATGQSGPSATALGSAAYPGNVIGNLPAIIEQASPGNGQYFPPYPLAARADYPAGPPEASQDIGTAAATVRATPDGAQAQSTLAASQIPGLIQFGSITTSASTGIEDGQVVSRSRSEVNAISLLFGLIRLEGVVTDMVATSNGEVADAAGVTTVGGVSILGLPAALGPDGFVIGETTAPTNPGPAGPLFTLLPPDVADGLAPVVDGLNTVLQQVLGGVGDFNDLLAASGVSIQVMDPVITTDGPEASITSNGLIVTMDYDGSGDNPLAQLLALIPADQLPGEGLPGVPLNTSPQAMVGLLKETHVTSAALAYGAASVVASPAFNFVSPTLNRPSTSSSSGSSAGSSGSPATAGRPGSPSFSTPTPALPTNAAGAPISNVGGGLGGAAVGAMAVLLAVLTSPLWAVGSTKLADNALAPVTSTCPEGLDKPIEPGGN